MSDLIERLRFLASGQDDPHSVAITEAADALEQQAEEIDRLHTLYNGTRTSLQEAWDAITSLKAENARLENQLWKIGERDE